MVFVIKIWDLSRIVSEQREKKGGSNGKGKRERKGKALLALMQTRKSRLAQAAIQKFFRDHHYQDDKQISSDSSTAKGILT